MWTWSTTTVAGYSGAFHMTGISTSLKFQIGVSSGRDGFADGEKNTSPTERGTSPL
jgi:hypothetical protein